MHQATTFYKTHKDSQSAFETSVTVFPRNTSNVTGKDDVLVLTLDVLRCYNTLFTLGDACFLFSGSNAFGTADAQTFDQVCVGLRIPEVDRSLMGPVVAQTEVRDATGRCGRIARHQCHHSPTCMPETGHSTLALAE